MELISIISKLEQEADLADDKMEESDLSQYYDGYGDGIQYAIDLLRKFALDKCNQKITELEFTKTQNLQRSLMLSQLDIPKVENPLGGCNATTRLFYQQRG